MRAIEYKLNIPKYLLTRLTNKRKNKKFCSVISCLSFNKKAKEPLLPGKEWVKVKTSLSGICGTDMGTILAKTSMQMENYSSFPSVVGHENIGIITEIGSDVTEFKPGDRVYVEPILGCEVKGLKLCDECKDGRYAVCSRFAEHSPTVGSGCLTGFNETTGGGWSEYFTAHKSQTFKIPKTVKDEDAVLVDAVASALQPVATHLPEKGQSVLVYGCGIIGLNTIGVLRALGFKGKIIAVYRYGFQGTVAKEQGADHIISRNIYEEISKITGGKILPNSIGDPSFEGGVDIVFDTVGSAGVIDRELRLIKANGKLVMIATASLLHKVDINPVWFKEITIIGSSMYSHCTWKGKRYRTYELAMELIRSKKFKTKGLVTHTFDIGEYKKALTVNLNKKKYQSMKVVFNVQPEINK